MVTSCVHIIPIFFLKKFCFTESLFVHMKIFPKKLLPFEKVWFSKKENFSFVY